MFRSRWSWSQGSNGWRFCTLDSVGGVLVLATNVTGNSNRNARSYSCLRPIGQEPATSVFSNRFTWGPSCFFPLLDKSQQHLFSPIGIHEVLPASFLLVNCQQHLFLPIGIHEVPPAFSLLVNYQQHMLPPIEMLVIIPASSLLVNYQQHMLPPIEML